MFNAYGLAAKHVLVHSHLVPFGCSKCDMVFKVATTAYVHTKNAHGDSAKVTYIEKEKVAELNRRLIKAITPVKPPPGGFKYRRYSDMPKVDEDITS